MYSYVNNEFLAPILKNKKFEEEDSNFEFNYLIVSLLVFFGSVVSVFLIYSKIRYV
jgi:hypothetical protein